MLTLTEEAATAVKTITAQLPDAPLSGVRIEGAGSPESQFALSVVDAPEAGDAVIENAGARVFLDDAAAAVLDDRVLDAHIDPEQGSVQFAVTSAA